MEPAITAGLGGGEERRKSKKSGEEEEKRGAELELQPCSKSVVKSLQMKNHYLMGLYFTLFK